LSKGSDPKAETIVFEYLVMGDDLGDFFAKKDKRKKKKAGTKVTSATLIEQLISDNANAEEQPQTQSLSDAQVARPDDSEWIEINNDHLAEGLSDLKIKSLTKEEEEEAAARQEQEHCENESEDENGPENKGPWAQLSSSPPKTKQISTQREIPTIPSGLVTGGKYVPPSQRQGSSATAPNPRRGREQINVNSVEQFPDLSAHAANKTKEKHDPTFDMAKGGGRKVQQQAKLESVQLNNKFKVLEQA